MKKMQRCAHCNMRLSKKAQHKKIKGKTYYFCTHSCEALFGNKKFGKKIDYKKAFG